jgi:endonuclease/exonuclease/phosphatase family metal-dependent hydrolase
MMLRVATFNVHHCRGADGVVDVERVGEVIAQAEPDVIGLQELDRDLPRSGHTDQASALARLLHMDVRFFPTLTRGRGEYGLGLGATLPPEEARFVPLPRLGTEEPRGAITASFFGLHVVVTHLSTDRRARSVQLATLGAIAAGLEGPTVVMGDLNLGTRSLDPLRRLGFTGAFGHSTLPGKLVKRQIDHILVSPEITLRRSWTIATDASDHVPLVAELEVPISR